MNDCRSRFDNAAATASNGFRAVRAAPGRGNPELSGFEPTGMALNSLTSAVGEPVAYVQASPEAKGHRDRLSSVFQLPDHQGIKVEPLAGAYRKDRFPKGKPNASQQPSRPEANGAKGQGACRSCRLHSLMPRRNRVTPFGEIVALSMRGMFMGNRGRLHDEHGCIGSRGWTTLGWVTCRLEYKGIRRQLMAPGEYTELFFLDEASALAAGHRPCAQCRNHDYKAFRAAFASGNGYAAQPPYAEIDRRMHADRLDPATRRQRRFQAQLADLPDGTFAAVDGVPCLWWGRRLLPWSPGGYLEAIHPPTTPLDILTPASTVAALRQGYRPRVHASADTGPANLKPVSDLGV